MKFRVELWRIAKFILITAAVNLPLSLLNGAVINALAASGQPGVGQMLSLMSWVFTLATTLIGTLLHRYFTFRAAEKWYIALPLMLAATVLWRGIQSVAMTYTARSGVSELTFLTTALPLVWLVLQYLLQRYVLYCHTTDQNGWYRRFHTDEKEQSHE